ncbi:NDP-sugar pyrophosphorylase family protein [Clostridium saccharoperbutylacetonicum]|uniref:Nucleoside-diphosphate-sugar pyrophosphorylase involved in lipopolysaccharide biosynthesis/translation initiation factor 2B gamma/epsilon subunits (EIF-2Bgamma/eIF-2Bepsilon)-like protein n=1 Tax=Clostridium saccharoperbutylacetonicum N1-4(HMT) TaxID=931276 RepID=M1MQ36_9CLOT|nr:phosphotransferase [Clostridium saccharoperbutylacetonicum]AGF58298.1 nucleoside-diphosphate-sugar pyrophosphorylase involved in lipopolysaccharide biosynthesis/translation initiation factor 2B gamma/epsilon subunits (EIF-2Bgamma/eIF-2Bepsilon)-like protein [Clostridium saccharoperbutylacetonicum N1-4(HMT)]NRT60925.1 NDP-sugar pyrophosphorylase family protein [Clostridium saccharoperbutylacetonicum]NSB24238.1 NDP-sugar pyrophosphorylase family protein [Clostridium saccharoperbutylacetonicum]
MKNRVFIPVAGTGSRLGGMTKYLNKSLISVSNKPAISNIIDNFSNDTEFVFALGYKGEIVKEFLKLAYPKRKFYFGYVDLFEGEGSGLGLSMLSCKQFLQQPFIFCSCDTLVDGEIPQVDRNWIGFSERKDLSSYRTVSINDNKVENINEKGMAKEGDKPYIGLAGIYDYKSFWDSMENGHSDAINEGEVYGLKVLMKNNDIYANFFEWYDTGTAEELNKTREHYKVENAPNILEKANETIWFLNDSVIKFSDDTKFISDRVLRTKELDGFIPKITGFDNHMYSYEYAKGEVMSKVVTLPIFEKLLEDSLKFWENKNLSMETRSGFKESCMKFYKDKTIERVELFYKNFNKSDGVEKINDIVMPTLKEMLDNLDWNWISDGLPGRFHGDFHFENILYSQEDDKFTFLDWRQNFGGSLTVGDIYYDFAKMLHGLIICHELIAKDLYGVEWKEDSIRFDFNRKQILVQCEKSFEKWIISNGYDIKKVKVLTALVYLNIAALHHHPYGLLLYALGKSMLFENL